MPEKKTEEEFLATARKRFEAAEGDEKPIREQALIDLRFVAGDQWDTQLKQDRERAGRPAMTFPRCHTFVQLVSNEARQNKPQIKFAQGDNVADKDTAEIYEGLARDIQYSSDAQIAYETSVEYSAGGSFGYYRFVTDYCDDDSDELDLKIVPVLDPFAVYGIIVPACFNREPKFGFVIEDVPKEEFEDEHGKEISAVGGWEDASGKAPGWFGTETARVAEYWYCEDKVTSNKSGSRKRKKTQVKFCKMTGLQVLPDTETDWLGYCIPIIPVLGKGMIISGKPQLFSVVRYQRAAQQMINYAKTRIAETLATAPISPYVVAEGQITKGDKKWENINTQVFPYVEYKQVDAEGKPAPPPQRQSIEPPIQGYAEFVGQEIDDMKATTGIFDASQGSRSNETSGTAIQRRQQQSNMTTMHFMDNLERSFKKGGLIMADMIPKVYDTDRQIQILGPDEAAKIVRINAQHQDENGKTQHYKVGGNGTGKYRPIVTMTRAFSTKRMESFDMMQQVVQGNPQLMEVVGDVMFQNSDTAGADILAERFKKFIAMKYPGLIDEEGDDPAQKAQILQGQLAQLQQHNQALNAYAQQLEKEKEGKVVEQQGKMQIAQMQEQSRQTIAMMQEETKRVIAEITTKAQDALERAKLDADLDQRQHVSAHEAATQAVDQNHQKELAAQAAQQAQQAQASDQSHEQDMANRDATTAAQARASDQQHQQAMAEQAAQNQPEAGR